MKVKKSEPKVYEKLMKVKIGASAFIAERRKSEGTRNKKLGEIMWEQEYYAFAKSPKGGFLTQEEMESNWKQFRKEGEHGERAMDEEGPRGYTRLYVRTGEAGEEYVDVCKSRLLQRTEQMKRPTGCLRAAT